MLNYFSVSGVAINKDGVVYFADGANIRVIHLDGTITTMIGSQGQPTHFSPLPCESEISIHDVSKETDFNANCKGNSKGGKCCPLQPSRKCLGQKELRKFTDAQSSSTLGSNA